jgi:hypothetical protein
LTCEAILINGKNESNCLTCDPGKKLSPLAISAARNCTNITYDGYGMNLDDSWEACLIPNCKFKKILLFEKNYFCVLKNSF